jgi:hypothetical protein
VNGKILPLTGILSYIVATVFACVAAAESAEVKETGELLYNGIRLPAKWPPRLEELDREPMPLPYLDEPSEVIPIDVGRQLFVDDFLIEETTLKRTFHQAEYHPENPVLKPDRPWEKQGRAPCAMPFSDGVWYDPQEKLFKMWYLSPYVAGTCYATSRDGVHWEKPLLDVQPGTNIVLKHARDSSTVWLDLFEPDPKRRVKMFTTKHREGGGWCLALHVSPDGIHWSDPVATSPGIGDRTTVFYNPFRKVWVMSLRIGFSGMGRSRAYREHSDAVAALSWQDKDTYLWVGADRLDPRHPDPQFGKPAPQLYNLDAVAYESLMLGLFSVWQGPENNVCSKLGIQKRNEVLLGFSRDGFHWQRPDRRPFIGVNPTEGVWNWGNVQSAGGGCLVVGDNLYFYVSGRALDDDTWDRDCSTGLATLRRDGFASMDAGNTEGTLTTRLVRFRGKHLFVNLDADDGRLVAEILDDAGRPIEPFTRDRCTPLAGDKTLLEVKWNGADDLSSTHGKAVRFRFTLCNGSLYSFWVSPSPDGPSGGYVAAGGPGLTGPVDTQGSKGYPSTP